MHADLKEWTRHFTSRPKCRCAGDYLTVSADKKKKSFVMAIATSSQTYLLTQDDFKNGYTDKDALPQVYDLMIAVCYAPNKTVYPPYAFIDLLLNLIPNDTDLVEILGCQ